MTIIISDLHTISSQPVASGRSYQHLSIHDRPRIEAFFLSFDFDQRRSYFGGGISDQSIREYCSAIDWSTTDMIARTSRYCLEALATIVSLPLDNTKAELAVACPLLCDQRLIINALLAVVTEFATTKYRSLVVRRELGHPGLLVELRQNDAVRFWSDEVEIDLRFPSERLPVSKRMRSRA